MTDKDQVFAKCAWRLISFIVLLYVVNYIDRVNVGSAALTMNRDLGISPIAYGNSGSLLFFGYMLFQVPAVLILERFGARRTVFWILLIWGAVSASNALVQGEASLYLVRFLLGVAEAGFFPGMVFYLTLWFPGAYRARVNAYFYSGISARLHHRRTALKLHSPNGRDRRPFAVGSGCSSSKGCLPASSPSRL